MEKHANIGDAPIVNNPGPCIHSDEKAIAVDVTQQDYMLGLLDFTGELMRSAINSRPDENLVYVVNACEMLRLLYQGVVGLDVFFRRDMAKKIPVLLASLLKVENFVYQLQIRDKFSEPLARVFGAVQVRSGDPDEYDY